MYQPKTSAVDAPSTRDKTCFQDLIAGLRRDLGRERYQEADLDEPWGGACSPEELEARLAFYAARE